MRILCVLMLFSYLARHLFMVSYNLGIFTLEGRKFAGQFDRYLSYMESYVIRF